MDEESVENVELSGLPEEPGQQPQPEPAQPTESQQLEGAEVGLARQKAEWDLAMKRLSQDYASGQIDTSTALAMKQRYQDTVGQIQEQMKGLSQQRQALSERQLEQKEQEVVRLIPAWADTKLAERELRQMGDFLKATRGEVYTLEKIAQMDASEIANVRDDMKVRQNQAQARIDALKAKGHLTQAEKRELRDAKIEVLESRKERVARQKAASGKSVADRAASDKADRQAYQDRVADLKKDPKYKDFASNRRLRRELILNGQL